MKMLAGVLAVALLLVGLSALPQEGHEPLTGPPAAVQGPEELRLAMRKLWEEHVTWTRSYIVSELADLPDAGAVAQRLMRNQDEIGAALEPRYGRVAADKLAGLLREHIRIATDVVRAAKEGDREAVVMAQSEWFENASVIAAYLNGLNPQWSSPVVEAMLKKHLELTTAEVVARLKQDWPADIRAWDEGHAHMLMFADAFATGLAVPPQPDPKVIRN